MWDERYRGEEYVYGTEPNDFLAASANRLPPGAVLCLADGEGRNGVYLAQQGYAVTSVDQSGAGLAKARRLAEKRGVVIETVQADLAGYDFGRGAWAGIVSIFAHLPPGLRRSVHRRAVEALAPGGVFLLEAYTPAQVGRGAGGPPDPALAYTAAMLEDDLAGLEFLALKETERAIQEGATHNGYSAVVQVIAQKPGPAS